jgi:hypothetical protein
MTPLSLDENGFLMSFIILL